MYDLGVWGTGVLLFFFFFPTEHISKPECQISELQDRRRLLEGWQFYPHFTNHKTKLRDVKYLPKYTQFVHAADFLNPYPVLNTHAGQYIIVVRNISFELRKVYIRHLLTL